MLSILIPLLCILPPVDDTVVIRGQSFKVYPRDMLVQRGLDAPEVAPELNAAWVYVEAFNAMVDVPPDLQEVFDKVAGDGVWPEGDAGARLGAWLGENRSALDLARRAADMPDYYMPLFKGESDALLAAQLPTLSHHRQLARLFAVEAAQQQASGDPDGAIDNLLAAQRMANQVGNGKTLIEGLVGHAIAGLAERGLTRLAGTGDASAESLARAAAELESLQAAFPSFEHMVQAEGRWAASFIDDVVDAPGTLGLLGFGIGGSFDPAAAGPWDRFGAALRRVYLPDRGIKRRLRGHYDTLVAATRPRDDGSVGTIEEDKLFENIPAWDAVSRMILPSLSRAHELSLQAESNFVRTRLILAAAAYRRDHGAAPPTLSALVPKYVSNIPPDPMTGYEFEDAAPAGVAGLSLITSMNEADALRQKRRTPAILSPRAARWRRFVDGFVARHAFTEAQRNSAAAILRDVEARASAFERSHGASLQGLIESGQSQAAAARLEPLDELFAELKSRLDRVLTARQRTATTQPGGTGP